ncbi:MAG: hypothetical protein Q9168_003264 [Polycauliona sp. 1 TL-2023]
MSAKPERGSIPNTAENEASSSGSPLLLLPTEIRLIIYGHLFNRPQAVRVVGDTLLGSPTNQHCSERTVHDDWIREQGVLRTCRLIRGELLQLFYQNCHFVFESQLGYQWPNIEEFVRKTGTHNTDFIHKISLRRAIGKYEPLDRFDFGSLYSETLRDCARFLPGLRDIRFEHELPWQRTSPPKHAVKLARLPSKLEMFIEPPPQPQPPPSMSTSALLRLATRTHSPSATLLRSPICICSAPPRRLLAPASIGGYGNAHPFSTTVRRRSGEHGEESFEEFTASKKSLSQYEKEFDGVQDVFELQRNLNNAFAYDLVPSPSVIIAALRAARRVNDYPTAVRIFEGIKAKVENQGQYEEYLDDLKPIRDELGVNLKEDLYPEAAS